MFTHVVNLSVLSALIFFAFLFTLNKKSLAHKIFSWISVASFIWILTNYLADLSKSYYYALLFSRMAIIGPAFIPSLFLHFSWIFPDKKVNHKFWYFIIYIPSLIFLYFTPYDINISSVIIRDWGVEINAGPLYTYIFVYFLIYSIYAIFNLIKSYKKSGRIIRLQLIYILLGIGLSSFIGLFTNAVLVLLGITRYTSFGFLAAILFIYSTYYAITRYRLMNIRLVITRSILYTVLVATVASFFAFSIFWLAPKFGGDSRNGKIVTTILSSILIVLFLDPVKRVWAKVTDRIFFKDRIDYSAVLREASLVVAKEIDLDKLLHNLTILLSKELKLKKVKVFMPKNEQFVLTASSQEINHNFQLSSRVTGYFAKQKDLVITEELVKVLDDQKEDDVKKQDTEEVVKELENINAEMVIPIVESNQTNALFILSRKLSGDIFDSADIDFFKVLAPQIATAIEKSKLYEEVQELNVNLQAKVEERTKSLEQANLDLAGRNKYLTTMQVIINMVSRTLDLKQVTQMIADSIATELGYVGGVLSFVSSDNKLRAKAVTKSKKAQESVDLLPEDIFHYQADLTSGYNLGVETVLTAKINFSDRMTEFFSPPVEKNIIDQIQEKLGVKTIVGVPIFSEDRIIGVVHFLLAVEREKISPLDIEMMTSLTSQVGIVSRNLALYENIQKVNRDLNEANLHLKALDKAKSEFLSIASHQLRTPVSALKGYLSMMMEGDFGPLPEKISKLIGDLFESASRLARTINIFLNVSRIEAGRLKLDKHPIQINQMIESVFVELKNSAVSKNIKLNYHKPSEEMPLIYADNDKLREVVLNLVDNAIKYTPEGSITVSLEHDDHSLTFMSQDTGIGINPEEAKTLFRKFVRGDGVAQIHTGGSGLGLFIAQKIIKEHEGEIWVESPGKGQGSTFKFKVPLATAEQIAAEEQLKAEQEKKKI